MTTPDGWFTFGSFAPYPWVSIEFSEELDEAGMPLWEHPTIHEWEWDYGVAFKYPHKGAKWHYLKQDSRERAEWWIKNRGGSVAKKKLVRRYAGRTMGPKWEDVP